MSDTKEFNVSDNVRKVLSEETALLMLERSDKLVDSTLDQLRKSTDRSYTLFGLLVTAFTVLTAFVLDNHTIYISLPAIVLWVGLGASVCIMFSEALWVHAFRSAGNEPRNLVSDENVNMLVGKCVDADGEYRKHMIFDSIEDDSYAIDVNDAELSKRTIVIRKVMKIIEATVVAVAFTTSVMLFCRFAY